MTVTELIERLKTLPPDALEGDAVHRGERDLLAGLAVEAQAQRVAATAEGGRQGSAFCATGPPPARG